MQNRCAAKEAWASASTARLTTSYPACKRSFGPPAAAPQRKYFPPMRAAGPLLAGIFASGLAAGGCHRKPDATLTLPAERGVSLVRRDEPPVALDPESQ